MTPVHTPKQVSVDLGKPRSEMSRPELYAMIDSLQAAIHEVAKQISQGTLTRRSSAGLKVTDEIVERAIPHLRHLNIAGKDQWRKSVRNALTAALEPLPSHAGEDDGADTDRMQKISEVIAHLQSIKERFGDTCVYIRRGGMSWGAVALNRRDDDKKNGAFDLQAQHDRDMTARMEQVQRLIDDNRELRARVALTPSPTLGPSDAEVELTDDMVIAAMAEIPGVDHDDMARALQAALGLEVEP